MKTSVKHGVSGPFRPLFVGVVLLVLGLVLTGCAGSSTTTSSVGSQNSTSSSQTTPTSTTTSLPQTTSSSTATTATGETTSTAAVGQTTSTTGVGADGQPIVPSDFSATIDNKYMPLTPGAVFTYGGKSSDGDFKVLVTVMNDTKEIMGVTCVVVHDEVTTGGSLTEDTYDWYAQDKDGNVWYFGEDTKELDNGKVTSTAGSWEAGVNGALPGMVMKADPKVGDTYKQEYLKGEAEDMAQVLALGEKVTIPKGSFQDCLRTKEWTPLEPGVTEEKQYAPGVGMVKASTVQGGSDVEELISVTGT